MPNNYWHKCDLLDSPNKNSDESNSILSYFRRFY
jgi:hypothetical protein